jgi:hypothetical protein
MGIAMRPAGLIHITDRELSFGATIFVRYDDATVGLVLSLTSDDEVEVTIDKNDARNLIELLRTATES